MSDGDLFCNFKKCRKILSEIAFITRCSHAFCEEDGIREIQNQNVERKCPACQTPLVQSYDLVKVSLNPSEEYKSMVLAGIRPEYVMDVATRAIMFWNYQLHQEYLNQKMAAKHLKDTITQMKNDYDTECRQLKSEIQCYKKKIGDLEKEQKDLTQKYVEMSEKVAEKTRELQKWQMTYEALRRKQLSEFVLKRDNNPGEALNVRNAMHIGPQTLDDILVNRNKPNQRALQKVRFEHEESPHLRRDVPSPGNVGDRNGASAFNFQPNILKSFNDPKMFFDYKGYHIQTHQKGLEN